MGCLCLSPTWLTAVLCTIRKMKKTQQLNSSFWEFVCEICWCPPPLSVPLPLFIRTSTSEIHFYGNQFSLRKQPSLLVPRRLVRFRGARRDGCFHRLKSIWKFHNTLTLQPSNQTFFNSPQVMTQHYTVRQYRPFIVNSLELNRHAYLSRIWTVYIPIIGFNSSN